MQYVQLYFFELNNEQTTFEVYRLSFFVQVILLLNS